MAREASLEPPKNAQARSDVLSGVGSFGQNVASLAGLQAQLLALDFRESLSAAAPAIVALLVAASAMLASLVVAIAGAAWLLATLLSWPAPQSLLIVSMVIIIVASVVAIVAVRSIQQSCVRFRRSGEELERNVAWIKTVLAQSGRP